MLYEVGCVLQAVNLKIFQFADEPTIHTTKKKKNQRFI